jgi:hypothetical protein
MAGWSIRMGASSFTFLVVVTILGWHDIFGYLPSIFLNNALCRVLSGNGWIDKAIVYFHENGGNIPLEIIPILGTMRQIPSGAPNWL